MKNRVILKILVLLILAGGIAGMFFAVQPRTLQAVRTLASTLFGTYGGSENMRAQLTAVRVPALKTDRVTIENGATFAKIMADANVSRDIAEAWYAAAKEVYDLAEIHAGRVIEVFSFPGTETYQGLRYAIDTEKYLRIERTGNEDRDGLRTAGAWTARIEPIPYTVQLRTVKGQVESSVYEAALGQDIDERAIIAFGDAMQWSVDFAMDPRVGDTFSFTYEERYLNGEYAMPGNILAGRYVNSGETNEVYYFKTADGEDAYYDEKGNAAQKIFLRSPVAFKYISSGFTSGSRYVKEFNVSTGHRAIDYAAPHGTPIRAVGDGVVSFAGWSSAGYGNLTSIRHTATYSTNYAHQSRIAVKRGQRVTQGQVIGYVGSTGFSTGPHLHFEMVKNGSKINPLKEVFPPGEPIKAEFKEEFERTIEKYRPML